MLTEIIISGFGGQGILFTGKCLAYAAMIKNAQISWLPSYGPEMRGGTANCSVCISDEPIGSPLVVAPDILIAMNTPSVERFLPKVKSGGKAFIDSSIADISKTRDDIQMITVEGSAIADKNGLNSMGNIVILGKVLRECKDILCGIDKEAVFDALPKVIPPHKSALIDKNKSALDIGYSL